MSSTTPGKATKTLKATPRSAKKTPRSKVRGQFCLVNSANKSPVLILLQGCKPSRCVNDETRKENCTILV